MKNTVEKNKLIMEFMGLKPKLESPDVYSYSDMPFFSTRGDINEVVKSMSKYVKYNSSWDWLMPVVEKIGNTKDLKYENSGNYSVNIGTEHVWVDQPIGNRIYFSGNDFGDRKRPLFDKVYDGVVHFIEWYNHNKK